MNSRITSIIFFALLSVAAIVVNISTSFVFGDHLQHSAVDTFGNRKESDHLTFFDDFEIKKTEKLGIRQARKQLLRIVREVDINQDGFISKYELISRLRYVHDNYINESTLQMWQSHNPENRTAIKWQDIVDTSYKFLSVGLNLDNKTRIHGETQMMKDKKRFNVADFNKDNQLSFSEFTCFIHPHICNETKYIITEETMFDMDTNKDGFIDVDEYVYDIWAKYAKENDSEPEWVGEERINFKEYRDIDKDGKLDLQELASMLNPPNNYDALEMEADHLIRNSDNNKDGKLSADEILGHSELFMNNTNLHIVRDEL
ncbi:hypothetical protein GJ496_001465 [Pomphorhynchus laevis]|nr:hypothetical protein GJ496_001465 [Pomphorhynchus laevis]